MNIVFIVITAVSLIMLIIDGTPSSAIAVMLEGAKASISLSLKLCAIYAVWIGVLKIAQKAGAERALSQLFAPVTKRLFKGEDKETSRLISMNLATNLLGIGGAATPLAIAAMERMENGEKATKNMVMLTVLGSTGLQLIPATVIAMRASCGSVSPSDIFLPSLLATALTTLLGIIMVAVFVRRAP